MGLEQVIADAKDCASNFWWQAHDAQDYNGAAQRFVKQEAVIARYTGVTIDAETASYHFAEALRTYDRFVTKLKESSDALDLQRTLLAHFTEVYASLGYSEEVAKQNHAWWINWAYSRISQKKLRSKEDKQTRDLFNKYHAEFVLNLQDEHKTKYDLDTDAVIGISALNMAAIYRGHNTRNWSFAEAQLGLYYQELFTTLETKKSTPQGQVG